ncbi:hypothetical protein GCM10012275_44900 [Longimycelium tulufanense]|uniref:ABC3 transporter permease C-terminal domain-containing protein n=1 Tax=Longimycelium tulufanense TaxID=907463 RepID=A0A8J3CBD6_9PSEU|nr:FtsX-like permease family protein [Longimycelium tulufanense]GGM69483.1 hypothetical protein GCM10012275_44900 [Longimycelium tulufanense]
MRNRFVGWLDELLLGARMAVGGGRAGLKQVAVVAVGIGLGVAVLLLAASVTNGIAAKDARAAARLPHGVSDQSPDLALRARHINQVWQDTMINGYEVAATRPEAPVPPGLPRLPGPGEAFVSPAVADAIANDQHGLLRARIPERIVGLIGDDGLLQPGELYLWVGLPADQVNAPDTLTLRSFGYDADGQSPVPREYRLLLNAATAAMLVPIGVFVLVATRLGAAAREQRLAAVRLAGAGPGQANRIASGEALASAVLGLVIGTGLFLAVRPLAWYFKVRSVGFFPHDLVPAPLPTALVVLGVPTVAVLAALVAMRRIEISPLGVVRRGTPSRRRVWWRFIVLVVGAAMLWTAPLASSISKGPLSPFDPDAGSFAGIDWQSWIIQAGLALVLLGVASLVPWLVELVARNWGPTPMPLLFAVRRLRDDVTTSRVTAAVIVVLAGGLALQVMLATTAREVSPHAPQQSERAGAVFWSSRGDNEEWSRVRDAVTRIPGVRGAYEMRTIYMYNPAEGRGQSGATVYALDCAALRDVGVTECRPGMAWSVGPTRRPVGTKLQEAGREESGRAWSVPRTTEIRPPEHSLWAKILIEGAFVVAEGGEGLPQGGSQRVLVVRGDRPDLIHQVLAATAPITRQLGVEFPVNKGNERDQQLLESLRAMIIAGSTVVVLLAVLSLMVAALDQTQERRRPLAVLGAVGVRHRTLAWAVVWQNAVPALLGLVLAVPAGLFTGWLVMNATSDRIGARPPIDQLVLDWPNIAIATGTAGALVLLVTLSTLPSLRAAIKPSALRHE